MYSAYNNKNVEVYSPTDAARKATPFEAVYAVQVDESYAPPSYPPPPNAAPVRIVAASRALSSNWEIGLFECFCAPAHCCMAFFFPYINGGYAAHGTGGCGLLVALYLFLMYAAQISFAIVGRMYGNDEYVRSRRLTYMYYYDDDYYDEETTTHLTVFDALAAGAAVLFVIGVAMLRSSVRKFYRIPGSCCKDACSSIWCSCCALTQMSAHTERAKKNRRTTTLPGYSVA